MPRIPRRSKGAEQAAPPEEQSGETQTSPDGSTAPAPDAPAAEQPTVAAPALDLTKGDAPAEQPATPAPALDLTKVEQRAAAISASDAPSAITAEGQPTVAVPPLAATPGDPLGGVPAPPPEGEAVAPGNEVVVVEEEAPADARPGFRHRTRMRRRLRYLRRLRELAFRDLGGLVFDLHRFGRERNDLVAAKLEALANIDRELRTLQDGLQQRQEFTDLREAGIAACPRCGTLHDTDANFCPGCGTSLRTAIVRDAAPVTVTPAAPAPEPEQPQQATPTTS